jgi:AcrR family transcriptional regulator
MASKPASKTRPRSATTSSHASKTRPRAGTSRYHASKTRPQASRTRPQAGTTRSRNARGEGDKLRGSLLQAARELLVELGDQDKLTVRAVTARAGVSPNALYLHFADREALLSAVMLTSYNELRSFLRAAAATQTQPLEQLRALGRAYCEFAERHPGIYRVLFMTKIREGMPVPARGGPVGLDEGVDTFHDLSELVAVCVAPGVDPFERAAYLWAGLHGYIALRLVLEAFPWPGVDDYIDRLIAVHVAG